jgi:hypothetical protein
MKDKNLGFVWLTHILKTEKKHIKFEFFAKLCQQSNREFFFFFWNPIRKAKNTF